MHRQFVEIIYEAQGTGKNWEKVAATSLASLLFKKPELLDGLYSTAPDSELVESAKEDLNYFRYLENRNPSLCASVIFPEIFPLDALKYVEEMPDDISAAKSKVMNKILAGPVIPPRPLSRADRRYVDKKTKLFIRNLSKTFSKNEQRRLSNLKKNRDAKLACKYLISSFRFILQDTRMTSLFVRYGDKL